MKAALVVTAASLFAYAQPSTGSQAKEKTMHGAPPTQDDIRAEQDRIAALIDRVAVEIGDGQPESDAPARQSAQLPQGPDLTADALEAGIARLAIELKGPAQTNPEFVGRAIGVALAPDNAGEQTGAEGRLGSGHYAIAVWPHHREAPGQHVSIRVERDLAHACALDFARLSGQLEKAGYKGQKRPRWMDPSFSFSKNLGTTTGFVRLDVDSHDAPRCILHVAVDLEARDA